MSSFAESRTLRDAELLTKGDVLCRQVRHDTLRPHLLMITRIIELYIADAESALFSVRMSFCEPHAICRKSELGGILKSYFREAAWSQIAYWIVEN